MKLMKLKLKLKLTDLLKHKKGDSSKKTSSVAGMPATPAAPAEPQPPAQSVTTMESVPTVEASSIPASAAATAPIASTSAKTADPTSITSATFAWTAAQDAVLIGMCIQHKTWGEIGEAIPEKGMGEIHQRYNYLHLKYHGVPAVEEKDAKGGGVMEEVVTGKAVNEEKGNDKEEEPAGKGKGKEKAKGGGKAKGKGGETKAGPSSSKGKGKEKVAKKVRIASPEVSEASDDGSDSIYPNDSDTYSTDTDESAIDPGDFPRGWTRPANFQRYRKGVLQVVEVDPDEQEPVQIGGKPIVYVQPEDNLDEEMVCHKSILI